MGVPAKNRTCVVVTCGRPHKARGYCNAHYDTWRRHTAYGPRCSVEACKNRALTRGVCPKHYMAARRKGGLVARVRTPRHGVRRMVEINGRRFYRSRVVWERHHGPIPSGHEIHHVNGDRGDDRLENLELIEREAHIDLHLRKLTPEQVREVWESPHPYSTYSEFNVSKSCVWALFKRKTYRAVTEGWPEPRCRRTA